MTPDRNECELLCEVGSGAHGLAIAGTDDHDEMGIYVEDRELVIGLRKWETSVIRTHADGSPIPQGERSGPGDTDLVIHSLRKWIGLALNGNPTIIALMFAPAIIATPGTGQFLRLHGPKELLSRRALDAYLGYLKQQRERLMGVRGQKRTKRPELVAAYGYDTKYAAHALRLGLQGLELAHTGRLSMPMQDVERDTLLAVRRGEVGLEDVLAWIADAEDELTACRDDETAGVLPDQPNYDWANDFLVDTYTRIWQLREMGLR